ncbi:hypothetical protein CPB86DRAFT_47653 [Serendipita vermifera]|nr:hypothetical protein CPB86DRAFT_47653 [Serendipita vermifera]
MKYNLRTRSNGIVVKSSQRQPGHSQHAAMGASVKHAPIHRLPAEIIRMILLHVLVHKWDWEPPVMLGGVCRRWREILNNTKNAWNDITIREYPNRTYPSPELLQIILERASGSPIKLSAECGPTQCEWILKALHGASLDVIALTLRIQSMDNSFTKLAQMISELTFPSLEELGIFLYMRSDSPGMRSFLKDFLDMGGRSQVADKLHLTIQCNPDTQFSILTQHDVFLKARELSVYTL